MKRNNVKCKHSSVFDQSTRKIIFARTRIRIERMEHVNCRIAQNETVYFVFNSFLEKEEHFSRLVQLSYSMT